MHANVLETSVDASNYELAFQSIYRNLLSSNTDTNFSLISDLYLLNIRLAALIHIKFHTPP